MSGTVQNDSETAVTEQSFHLIADSLPGLVSTMTAEGEVEFVNQQVLDYFGKSHEELKSWATSDIVHPGDLPRAIQARKRTLETGESQEPEQRLRRADGVYRWFHSRCFPACDR